MVKRRRDIWESIEQLWGTMERASEEATSFTSPPSAQQPSPEYGGWRTDPDDPFVQMLYKQAGRGWSEEEAMGVLGAAGLGEAAPGKQEAYMQGFYERMYGFVPERLGEEIHGEFKWMGMQPHRRAREAAGIPVSKIPGGRKPPSWQWEKVVDPLAEGGRPTVTRQGAQTFYTAESIMFSSYWLPGEEKGTVTMPIAPGKVGKRGQLSGAYGGTEIVKPFTPEGKPMTRRAPVKAGPLSPTPDEGLVLNMLIPLREIAPSGQGMIRPGVIGTVRQRSVKEIKRVGEEALEGIPAKGTTWDVAGGEQIIPFKGAAPVRPGAWESVELKQYVPALAKSRFVFERTVSPEAASLTAKYGLSKATLPIAAAGAFEQLLGKGFEDIQAIVPLKEPLGAVYSHMMAKRPQELAGILGVGVEELPETWQAMGHELTAKFRSSEFLKGITEEISYKVPVHESLIEAGYFKGMIAEGGMRKMEEEGMVEITTEPIPTLRGEFFTSLRREYPSKAPFVPYRELQRIRRVNPALYEDIVKEGRRTQEAYGAIAAAAGATGGVLEAPAGAIRPTRAEAEQVMATAREQAIQTTGQKDISKISDAAMKSAILTAAEETWGGHALEVGEGQYLADPRAISRFRASGTIEAEEATSYGRRSATAIEALAGTGGTEEERRGSVQEALQQQYELAASGEFSRRMLGSHIQQRGMGPIFQASEVLAGPEVSMPVESVLKAYGLKGEAAERFEEEWREGRVEPTLMAMGFPAQGDEPFSVGARVLHPEEMQRRGALLSEKTPFVASLEMTQMLGRDVDADRILAMLTGRVDPQGAEMRIEGGMAQSTPEQVERLARRAEEWGAGSLRGEYGEGFASVEAFAKRLDPEEGGWHTYTEKGIQEAYALREGMQERIGPTYNTLENIERRQGGERGPALSAATKFFGMVHGIRQRPEKLPFQLAQVMNITETFRPHTGWHRPVEGMGAEGQAPNLLGPGMASLSQGLLAASLQMMEPGSLDPKSGLAAFAPAELAHLLSPEEGRTAGLEKLLTRFSEAGETGRAGLAGEITKYITGEESELSHAMARTALGGVAQARAYGRLKKFAGTREEDIPKRQQKFLGRAQEMLAEIPQEIRDIYEAEIETSQQFHLMLSKEGRTRMRGDAPETVKGYALSRMEAALEEAPEVMERLGLRRAERVAPPAEMVDVIDTETGEIAQRPMARPAQPAAAPQAQPARAARVEEPPDWFEEAQEWPAGAAQEPQRPAAAAPPPPEEPPTPPTAAEPEDFDEKWGRVSRPESAYPEGWSGGLPREKGTADKRVSDILSRIFGQDVSQEQFREAVTGLTATLDPWSETISPMIQEGAPLSAAQKGTMRQMEKWRKTVERGLRQVGRGEAKGWGEGLVVSGRVLRDQTGAYAELGQAGAQLRLGEAMAGLAGEGPGELSTRGLAWLGQAGEEGLQALPGIGPARAGRVAGLRARFENLPNLGGITDIGQLAQVSGISEQMTQGMIPAAETEAAWWGAGGREAVGSLYGALQGTGITTPEGYARYGAGLRGQVGTLGRNIAGLGRAGADVSREQQFLEQVSAQAHRQEKEQETRRVELLPEDLDRAFERFTEQLNVASDGLEDSAEKMKSFTEAVEEGKKLSQRDIEEVKRGQWRARETLAAIGGLERAQPGAGLTPEMVARRRQAEDVLGAGWQLDAAQREQEPGLWQQGREAAGGILKGVTSGWGMMRLRRLWGMTAGYAMGQIPLAAQEEQAATQAAMVGLPMGEYQPGGTALSMMTYQAQRQNWQADVGRAAYSAWGGTQRGGMGEDVAAGIGIGGVAAGLGLGAYTLAGWAGKGIAAAAGPIGWGVAGAAALYGTGQYFKEELGTRERRSLIAAKGPFGGGLAQLGKFAALGWKHLAGQVPEGAPEELEYGWELQRGELEGLEPEGQIAAVQYAAEEATGRGGPLEFMTTTGASQLGAQWRRQWGGTNIKDIFADPRFKQMALRGMSPEQISQMGQAWGVAPRDSQQILDQVLGVSEMDQPQHEYVAGQWQGLRRFGIEGMDIRREAYPGGDLGQLDAMGEMNLGRMLGGSQQWWSQAGRELGMEQWQTVNQGGMGIGTMWGGDILGGRMGDVGAPGRNIDVTGGDVTFNVTGQTVGFNQWDIQDYAVEQQRGQQDWQYGFQRAGLDLQASYTTGEGGPFAGRGAWQFQDAFRDLSRGRQMEQFGFQREGMDVSDRQFRERWQMQWGRIGVGEQEWEEDAATQQARRRQQYDWQKEDLAFQGARSSLQYGWQMEDFEEAERFATGRQRRRIGQQRERATISYGMGMGRLEEMEERAGTRFGWGEEDQDKSRERHDRRIEWQREEMLLTQRHHEERTDLSGRQLDAAIAHFQAVSELQDQQTDASREYWKLNFERQEESLEKSKEYRDIQREIQDAQTALGRAQQLHVSEWRAAFEEGGPVRTVFRDFVDWLQSEITEMSSNRGDIYLPRTRGGYDETLPGSVYERWLTP